MGEQVSAYAHDGHAGAHGLRVRARVRVRVRVRVERLALAARRRREDLGLLGRGQLAVQRQQVPARGAGHPGEVLPSQEGRGQSEKQVTSSK
jgi:hypothetical protein